MIVCTTSFGQLLPNGKNVSPPKSTNAARAIPSRVRARVCQLSKLKVSIPPARADTGGDDVGEGVGKGEGGPFRPVSGK